MDDHGDQFPGAVPLAAPTAPRPGAGHVLPRMHAEYVHKLNSVLAADREDLAVELAQEFDAESAEKSVVGGQPERVRHTTGRGTPTREGSGRPPGSARAGIRRAAGFTRRSLDRFDAYTLDVFNPGAPFGRSER
jgi:hypothetical protein